MKYLILIISVFPQVAFAVEKPSMTSMWMELIFLVVMLFALKIAQFSNKNKFIVFITYILSGIITQTLWFPVVLFIGMYVVFTKNDTGNDSFS